jgi:hypothetical protein
MAVNPPRHTRFAPQWLLLVIILLCLVGGVVWLSRAQPARSPVIQAARDIPAFTLLSSSDLVAATLPAASVLPGTATRSADVIGRLVTVDLKKGATIAASALLSPTVAMQDWLIVSVPISSSLPLKPGERVLLWGVSGGDGQALLIADQALVLAAAAGAATVAAPPDAIRQALGYRAAGRLLLVKQVQ